MSPSDKVNSIKGLAYELNSIKAELENKVFLILIKRTFARRQGQTRLLLVILRRSKKLRTHRGKFSSPITQPKGSPVQSPITQPKLSHIAITEDMAAKKHLSLKAHEGTLETDPTIGIAANEQLPLKADEATSETNK